MTPQLGASILILVLSFYAAGAFAPPSPTTPKSLIAELQSQVPTLGRGAMRKKPLSCSDRRPTHVSLRMTAVPVAAITGALTGGLFAGGLHAIAGKLKNKSPVC